MTFKRVHYTLYSDKLNTGVIQLYVFEKKTKIPSKKRQSYLDKVAYKMMPQNGKFCSYNV